MLPHLAHSIYYGVWMIDESFVHANFPLIEKVITGETIEVKAPKLEIGLTLSGIQASAGERINVAHVGSDSFKSNSVAVLPLQNAITKRDMFCGPAGTLTMMNWHKRAMNDDNVIAVVYDVDCPGGEATMIEPFAQAIQSSTKPVLFHFSGLNTSAAFWLSCAAQEVYASEGTDTIGSCGVMMTFLDIIPALEEKKIKYHEIYADQSKQKNKLFAEARKGNYEPLKKQLLNPFAEKFIASIKEMRPGMKNPDIFEGATFNAKDAIGLGMMDGIMSLEATIQRAYELGQEKRKSFSNSNKKTSAMSKKHVNLLATISAEQLVVDEEKGSYLQATELDAVEAALATASGTQQQLTALQEELSTLKATHKTVTDSVAAKDQRITELEAENEALGKKPAGGTAVSKGKDHLPGAQAEEDFNDPEHPTNKELEAKYGFNPAK
jgi:protease-4